MSAVVFSRTKLCSHRNFQVIEIHVSVKQLLMLVLLSVKIGPENPTSYFVLSSEALSCFPVIESVLPNFTISIICFRP